MALELETIYNEVVSAKLDYCELCLRSEREVILVPAVNIEAFVKYLAPNLGFQHRKWKKACFMCEGWAAKGRKLVHSLLASTSATYIFVKKKRAAARPHKPIIISQKELEHSNNQLKEIRSRILLQQTEVLMVDSKSVFMQSMDTDTVADSRDLRLLPNTQPSEHIETVILDDDDQPSSSPQLSTNTNPAQFNQFLPILNSAGLNAPMILAIPPAVGSWITMPDMSSLAAKDVDTSNVNLSPNYSDTFSAIRIESVHTVDEVVAPNDDATNMNNYTRISKEQPKCYGKRNLNSNDNVLKKPRQQEYTIDIDTINRLISEQNTPIPKLTEKAKAAKPPDLDKAPLANKERIDWEDKIPMDVISFVDATDPNADPLLSSLRQAPLRPTRQSAGDIIDLC